MTITVDTDDQAYEFFVQESLELLQVLENGLLTLAQDHETQKIHSLMRAAHSIKGGAACIGLTAIQTIAHDLENGIRALYREDTVFDADLEDIFLQAFDVLKDPINEQITTGTHHPDRYLNAAQPIFQRMEEKLGHPLEEAAEFPEVHMEGDITDFIFAEEIPQALDRWQQLVNNRQQQSDAVLIEEFKGQADVLATLGEMLNLMGFLEIAQLATQALEHNPQDYKIITQLALDDLLAGQEAVLDGDRTQGGQASDTLRQYAQGPITKTAAASSPVVPEEEPEAIAFTSTTSLLSPEEMAALEALTQEEDVFDLGDLDGLAIVDETEVVESPPTPAPEIIPEPEPEPEPVAIAPPEAPPVPAPEIIPEPEPEIPPAVAPAPKKEESLSFSANTQDAPGVKADLSVRVDLDRLNLINNQVGELVTQDNSFQLRNRQEQVTLDAFKRWFNRFNKLTGQFRQVSKEMAIKNPQMRHKLAHFVKLSQVMSEEMAQLGETIEDSNLLNQQDQQMLKQRQQTLKSIERNLLEARMLAIGDLLNRFPRTVRDLSRQGNKPVRLQLEGENTLVDRAILSKLYDPLVHLVRNAFDHGIDGPEDRKQRGKPEEGLITIKAYNRGNSTYVEVKDDGQGINAEKIRKKAIEKGLITAAEAEDIPQSQLLELIFVPGFSTAEKVSHISGRGVGLDAVRLQIRSLRGNLTLSSEPGQGTTFTIRLPWSITITRLLVFRLQDSFFAISVNSLSAIAAASPEEIHKETVKGKEKLFYRWQGQKVPLEQNLLLNYSYPSTLIASQQQMVQSLDRVSSLQTSGKSMILVLSQGKDVVGLKIDQILMEQDLVIKSFSKVLEGPAHVSGCTVLGDGRLVPVLDGASLLERALYKQKLQIKSNLAHLQHKVELPTILAIDDSLTTRQTLAKTLQKGGYRVIQAQDGVDGLNQLEQHPEVQGIICDVEMPNMNGFEFLGRCRKKHKPENLPVLMLTSRSSKRYRQLAKQLGANGYLTKPYLDKELIETLQASLDESVPVSSV